MTPDSSVPVAQCLLLLGLKAERNKDVKLLIHVRTTFKANSATPRRSLTAFIKIIIILCLIKQSDEAFANDSNGNFKYIFITSIG